MNKFSLIIKILIIIGTVDEMQINIDIKLIIEIIVPQTIVLLN